nr:hypothetical protein BaRGS_001487 [Batillaria attramentaria]
MDFKELMLIAEERANEVAKKSQQFKRIDTQLKVPKKEPRREDRPKPKSDALQRLIEEKERERQRKERERQRKKDEEDRARRKKEEEQRRLEEERAREEKRKNTFRIPKKAPDADSKKVSVSPLFDELFELLKIAEQKQQEPVMVNVAPKKEKERRPMTQEEIDRQQARKDRVKTQEYKDWYKFGDKSAKAGKSDNDGAPGAKNADSQRPTQPEAKQRRVIDSEEEEEDDYDDDLDDFIDDEGEEDMNSVSGTLQQLFPSYYKKRHQFVDDDDDSDMEVGFSQVMKEEARSARLGLQEDLEDIRREQEELRQKALKKKMMKKR